MKKFLLATLLVAPVAVFAAAFEGKISMTMSAGGGASREITYEIKGDKLRIDLGKAAMITDTTKRESIMVMDEQKMYMTMPIPDPAAPAPGEKKSSDATLEKTSETEKILGYTATKYIATHDGSKTDLWLAEGIGTFMSPTQGNPMMGGRGGRGGGQAPQAWERALAGKELFPLRVVSHDKSGRETARIETTAINKQSLPDSLFAPPAGYRQFDMGGMMRGMMPGGFPGKN